MISAHLASIPATTPVLPKLIDTHNHFDDEKFCSDRIYQSEQAYQAGVRHMLMTGYLAQHFDRLLTTQTQINQHANTPTAHIALGLHPDYILHHTPDDLDTLSHILKPHGVQADEQPKKHQILALGEIGLDTYRAEMKQTKVYQRQQALFHEQLTLAYQYQLPVLLHIRKAHADALQIIKQHPYNAHELGGIAHSFSGGEQEAKAFVKLGFKLGITGQVTNPNAKKLHLAIKSVVAEYGLGTLVIETDAPDMLPHTLHNQSSPNTRNTPANLPCILTTLSDIFDMDSQTLAQQLWHNSCQALKVNWVYQ